MYDKQRNLLCDRLFIFMDEVVTEIDRNVQTVSVPSKTKYISDYACFNGTLSSLSIENSQISIIGKYAFAQCFNLKEIIFPSSLEVISEGAFNNCVRLTSLIFKPDSKLRKIGFRAFSHCACIKNIKFPPLLETIEEGAFVNRNQVMKLFDLRNTQVRYIGPNAFNSAIYNEILLPPTVTLNTILNMKLLKITIDALHPIVKKDGCGYYTTSKIILYGDIYIKHVTIREGTEIIWDICFRCSELAVVTIPASVEIISTEAFNFCMKLQRIIFAKDSRLIEIKDGAFSYCYSLRKVNFPKTLRIIRKDAFSFCSSLVRVSFPHDSQLEEIKEAFKETEIGSLSLPLNVRKICDVSYGMNMLESIYVNNEFYKSNIEKTAIYSKDGRELICVIKSLNQFKIPEGVIVIKRHAFNGSYVDRISFPSSVEVIEDEAFLDSKLQCVEFASGSRLKSLGFNTFPCLDEFSNINNEDFITTKEGVVMSLNPMGIVFVPKHLTELVLNDDIEVIYSCAFMKTSITSIKFPKSLKKICSNAFVSLRKLNEISFEEGTELDFIEVNAFKFTNVKHIKFPLIKEKLLHYMELGDFKTIEYPPNLHPEYVEKSFYGYPFGISRIVNCPRSSLQAVAPFIIDSKTKFNIID